MIDCRKARRGAQRDPRKGSQKTPRGVLGRTACSCRSTGILPLRSSSCPLMGT